MLLALLTLACAPTKSPATSDSARDSARPTAPWDTSVEQVPGTGFDDEGCNVLYAPDRVPVFQVELSEADWAALESDYASGVKQYHPARFTYVNDAGVETSFEDAAIRLRGNPGFSWFGEKMQFAIAFNEADPDGRFLGLRHLDLDASWYEPSLLRDRLAYAWLRHRGIPAPCANNAELWVNGAYYGFYKNIEYPDHEWLEREFGDEGATGVLWKYGSDPTVNAESADPSHMSAFWSNTSVAWQEANTDLQANIEEWSAEAVLPQNDGYWCCNHNFYLYEHPDRGILFLPWDMDFALDDTPYFADPYTWYRDSNYQPHFDAVITDPTWGPRFIEAMRESVDAYDPDLLSTWISEWGEQIEEPFSRDPHTPHSVGAQRDAVARLGRYVYNRHAWLDAWTRCREGQEDGDGDGYGPCEECDDQDPTINPSATESCDGRDDDCDGLVDDEKSCDDCDEFSFEGSRFLLCTTPRTWAEAEAVCEANGGALGYPVSTGDWYVYWIHNYWQELYFTGHAWWWIGATDAASEGTWLDPSGAPVSPGWGGGAPGGGTAENCAATSPNTWSWDDLDCAAELPAFCRLTD